MNKRISLYYGFVRIIYHADSPFCCLQLIQVKIVAFFPAGFGLLTSFPANLGISFPLNKILTFKELLAMFLIAIRATMIVSVSDNVSRINSVC